MGRTAHWIRRPSADHSGTVTDRLHRIDECLSEDWVEAWAGEVVAAVEDYLGKHAAFEAFLGEADD